MFADSDKVSHRLRSGFLIHVNIELVQWSSKKQSTVETSVFGTEFATITGHRCSTRLQIQAEDDG